MSIPTLCCRQPLTGCLSPQFSFSLEFHINRIGQYVVFHVCHLSLMWCFGFHPCCVYWCFVPFYCWEYASIWIYLVRLFIHYLLEISIGPTLGLLWIMLLWAFTYKVLCGQMFSFLIDKYWRVECLGHVVSVCLIFWETWKCFPNLLYHFIFPSTLHDLVWPVFYIVLVGQLSYRGIICISLMTANV